jgi:flavin-dependent dehydrogenase
MLVKPEFETEICVAGGGPAGALLARRLAELGHQTLLVDRDAQTKPSWAESLAPSIRPILDSMNLRTVFDPAVFLEEKRALLGWGRGAVDEKSFEQPSLLVHRALFDELLRSSARDAGVRLAVPASARSPRRLPSGGWIVPLATRNGSAIVKTEFFIEARGRCRNRNLGANGPFTVALSAAWRPGARRFLETRIEAGRDAWLWGSPLPDDLYGATIFLDGARVAGLAGDARIGLCRALLLESNLLKDLARAQPIGPLRVRDATCGVSTELIGNDFIRIGDAAVSIDPLSSQGIQAALLSAIQGSAAVHTLLAAGHDPSLAIEFYRERRQKAARNAARNASRLYRNVLQWNASSFWLQRSRFDEDAPYPVSSAPPDPAGLPTRVGISPALRIIDAPILSGSFITRAQALSHPSLDHPVAFFGGAALAPLISDAAGASTIDQIMHRWTRRMPAETAWSVVKWLFAVGIIVPRVEI